jgi:outer membrane lipoprotein SlyB
MKWMLAALLAVTSLVPFANSHAQSVRHGTIVDMKPIDNRGDDESEQHKQGRSLGKTLGGLFGMKVTETAKSGAQATNLIGHGSQAVGEQVGGNVAGTGPAAHYMVKLKMDDGKTMALVQTGQGVQGLSVGSKVSVSGTGQDARLAAE